MFHNFMPIMSWQLQRLKNPVACLTQKPSFNHPSPARQSGYLYHIPRQCAAFMRFINCFYAAPAKPPRRSFSYLARSSVQKSFRVRLPYVISVKDRAIFPRTDNRFMTSLPKIKRGDIFIGIVPDKPPFIDWNFDREMR